MVKDTHGKRGLCQFAISHKTVGLESLVLGRAHTGEVNAVLGAPIVLLQIAQVVRHHRHIGAPLFLQSDEHTHTDRVYTCLPHTVEPVATPLKTALHAAWVVQLVVLAVVGFLKADHTVQSMVGQLAVFLHLQRHHLDLDVREVALGDIDGFCQIRHSRLGRILACYQQDVLERCQLLYCLILVLNLFGCQDGACHRVFAMKAAVHTRVGTRVGDIQRDKHRHGAPETLLGVFTRESGHLL